MSATVAFNYNGVPTADGIESLVLNIHIVKACVLN